MNTLFCEMFGHFTYDDHLTYQELLDTEILFIGIVQTLLEGLNAAHIDFTSMGDALMVQCAFDPYQRELFHALCEGLRPQMPKTVAGRLLFVDKHLDSLHVFHINHIRWRESFMRLPTVAETMRAVRTPRMPGKTRGDKPA